MKYLKEKFGKYFQFKNTINGTDYFLRGLAILLFIIPIAIFVGVGIGILGSKFLEGAARPTFFTIARRF